MPTSPFEDMKDMIHGKEVDIAGKEVILFFGLGFSNPVLASKINQYMFFLKPTMVQKLLCVAFYKQSMPKWIKKPKPVEDDITGYCKEHGIEDTPMLRKLVQENMGDFLREIRADDKKFKEMGISLSMPEKNQWF